MRHTIKPFLLCSALIASLTAFAQNWNTDSLRWNVLDNFSQNSERFLGETVLINDTTYRSIYYIYDCNATPPEEPSLSGYIRQFDEQIFFRGIDANHEVLLYDFSLETGDIFQLQVCAFQDELFIGQFGSQEVFAVDSVETLSGWRKRIHFLAFEWIEDLGSNRGPLDYGVPICMLDAFPSLQCVRNGDSLIYQHESLPTCCFSTLSLQADFNEASPFAAPNPLDPGVSMQLLGASSFAEATLYDSAGRLLNRWTWQQGHPFNPSASGLGAGMYILHLSDGRGHVVQKLILR